MPEVKVPDLQRTIEFILDLKAHQEAAQAELKHLGADLGALEKESQRIKAALCGLPRIAWIRGHLQQLGDRDLQDIEQLLRSRK